MRDSQGRIVIDVEYSRNVDGSPYIESALYDDDLTAVPDVELDYLQDVYVEIVEACV